MSLYKIKPLEWENGMASSVFGKYMVYYMAEDNLWAYEYNYRIRGTSYTEDEAKNICESHYIETIEKCLIKQ